MTLLQAMDEACEDINALSIQAWKCHTRRFCDAIHVDEVLWPDPAQMSDGA